MPDSRPRNTEISTGKFPPIKLYHALLLLCRRIPVSGPSAQSSALSVVKLHIGAIRVPIHMPIDTVHFKADHRFRGNVVRAQTAELVRHLLSTGRTRRYGNL